LIECVLERFGAFKFIDNIEVRVWRYIFITITITTPKNGYFCSYDKKCGFSAIWAILRGKNAIFPRKLHIAPVIVD
jgi:hypothetical protein